MPEHPPPLHPMKMLPEAGTAVRMTAVPELYEAEQVEPQLMLLSELVTVPVPVPVFVTVRIEAVCAEAIIWVPVADS